MAKKEKFSVSQVTDAIRKSKGIISAAASILGCERKTVLNYTKRHQSIMDALNDANESTIDFVESRLLKNIDNGDTTAMIFYLKCKAKERGYIDKIDVEHGGGKNPIALNVRITYDDVELNPHATEAS